MASLTQWTWVYQTLGNSEFTKSTQHISLSHVWLFATPWTAAHQASLSFTVSLSLLKLMSVMPSNHLILCHPFPSCLQSFPVSGSFLMSRLFTSGGQSFGASASASVLPLNIQVWFPLGLRGRRGFWNEEMIISATQGEQCDDKYKQNILRKFGVGSMCPQDGKAF